MIVEMTKLRVLGRRDDLPAALRELQDLGTLHIVETVASDALAPAELPPPEERETRYVRAALEDIDRCLTSLRAKGPLERVTPPAPTSRRDVACWARQARRVRRRVEALERRRSDLQEERALILRYRELFAAFHSLLTEASPGVPEPVSYCLVLRKADESLVHGLRESLDEAISDAFTMRTKTLDSGEAAVLLSVPAERNQRLDEVFRRAGVHEVPVPPSYGGLTVEEAIPRMLARLEEIPEELSNLTARLDALSDEHGDELVRARAALHDRLKLLETRPLVGLTRHAFVLDGWLPLDKASELETRLGERLRGDVAVEVLEDERWADESAPVTLDNPKLFKPFEVLVRFFPLPRYGSIDPTPFVAVFFPMFFGLVLGDVGYGALLGLLAWIVYRRSAPESLFSSLAKVAGACAAFTFLFGFLYGELFGDFGHKALGLPPLWFRREEAMLSFLGLALALGFVHVVLGLILGALGALRGSRREALGRGVAAVMIVLIVLALLAATDILPDAFFTPSIIAILVAFSLLVILEGLLAPFELLAAVSNIFSYARIMAIGTASVMMAIVANRMVGAFGSVVVGVLFALVFHLVNFALGVFSPTIHALRLHYVEFFGKFYRPGGAGYDPLRHWRPRLPNGGPETVEEV